MWNLQEFQWSEICWFSSSFAISNFQSTSHSKIQTFTLRKFINKFIFIFVSKEQQTLPDKFQENRFLGDQNKNFPKEKKSLTFLKSSEILKRLFLQILLEVVNLDSKKSNLQNVIFNYLKFFLSCVFSGSIFWKLWKTTIIKMFIKGPSPALYHK